jgi:hypothetical protein
MLATRQNMMLPQVQITGLQDLIPIAPVATAWWDVTGSATVAVLIMDFSL